MKKLTKMLLLMSIVVVMVSFAACQPKTYQYTFESNGGTAVTAIELKEGEALTAPGNPTRSGYDFAGWFENEDLSGTVYAFPATMPGKDIKLYAKWSLVNVEVDVTITFVTNGGTVISQIAQKAGTSLTKPGDPERTGYDFAGWYTDAGLTQSYTFPTTMPSANITLYAKWTAKVAQFRTFTFNVNEGTDVDSITARAGNTYTAPDDPVKSNYDFDGWYKNSDFSGNAYVFPATMPDEDITLYAKWNPKKFQIVFDTVGGSAIDSIVIGFGSPITSPADPTKPGYDFDGWYEDMEYAKAFDFPDVMPQQNIKVYAKWTVGASSLTFNSNGGSACTAINATTGSIITLPTPTKTDRLFAGWYLDAGLTTVLNASMPGGDNTAYAKWLLMEPGTKYNMRFVADGTTFASVDNGDGSHTYSIVGAGKSEWANLGSNIQFNVKNYNYVQFEYELVGTSTIPLQINLEGGGVDKLEHNWTPASVNTRLTETFACVPANLTDGINKMAVAFFINAGVSGIHATKVRVYSVSLVMAVAEDAAPREAIFFNANGTDKTLSPIYGVAGSTVTAPTAEPEMLGYVFKFWASTPTGTEAYVFDKMPAGPTVLYAIWDAAASQTLTFNTMGGSAIAPLVRPLGSLITPPNINPTKPGYTFGYWYADEACTQLYVFDRMEESRTVYAKWTPNASFTLTFMTNCPTEIPAITAPYGAAYTIPANPTWSGFTFLGWYTDADLTQAITLNGFMGPSITLYGKWSADGDYTVTFVTDGSAVEPITQRGFTAVAAQHSTLAGKVFAGWYLESTFINKWDGIMPAKNISVYAKFEIMSETGALSVLRDTTDAWTRSTNNHWSTITNTGTTRAFTTNTNKAATSYVYLNLTNYDFSKYSVWTANVYANGANKTMRMEIWNNTTGKQLAVSQVFTLGNGAANAANYSVYADLSTIAYANQLQLRFYFPNHTGTGLTITVSTSTLNPSSASGAALFEVQFNGNYTNAPVYRSFLTSGAAITAPSAAALFRSGYTLEGWYNEAGCTSAFSLAAMPAANTVAYAKWTENTAETTLTIDSRGGTAIAAKTQVVGTTVSIASPTKDYATFAGWYYDTAWNRPFDFIMPDTNTTVYARWNQFEDATKVNLITNIPVGGTAVTIVRNEDSYLMTPTTLKGAWDCFVFPYADTNLRANGYTYVVVDIIVTWTGSANHAFMLKFQGATDGTPNIESTVTPTAAQNGQRIKIVWTIPTANVTNNGGDFVFFLQAGQTGNPNTSFEVFDISLFRTALEAPVA